MCRGILLTRAEKAVDKSGKGCWRGQQGLVARAEKAVDKSGKYC